MISAFALSACGSKKFESNEPPKETQVNLIDGSLALPEKTLLLTWKKATKDQEIVNNIDPGDVSDIKVISQSFRFKTTSDSVIYLYDKNIFGLCETVSETGSYPKPEWTVKKEDGKTIKIQPRIRTKLDLDTLYILDFKIALSCSGKSFSSDFVVRLYESIDPYSY
jgi:hypothetical protein